MNELFFRYFAAVEPIGLTYRGAIVSVIFPFSWSGVPDVLHTTMSLSDCVYAHEVLLFLPVGGSVVQLSFDLTPEEADRKHVQVKILTNAKDGVGWVWR